jgi:NADPH2:quinone reductase
VIDLSSEKLAEGVRRLTNGQGVNLAIDSIGGTVTGQALASLKQGGVLVVLGYPAGTKATIDVTDLSWKTSRIIGFNLFTVGPDAIGPAVGVLLSLLSEGKVCPLVARTFPLEQAAEAQRYQSKDRPFGKVVLTV